MQLSATVHLHENANLRYQLIYASQLYGTFFVLYGKFTVTNQRLTAIDLKLINYKGDINIGIHNTKFSNSIDHNKEIEDYNFDSTRRNLKLNCITLDLDVQGNRNEASREKSIICDLKLEENLYFEVDCKVKPLSSSSNETVFDSEFFYREGLKPPTPINRHKPKDEETETELHDESDKAAGGLCPRGYSKIIIS